jgi:hypothetical protein
MPKIGKRSTHYSLSPWQTAGDKKPTTPSKYTVNEVDVLSNEKKKIDSQTLSSEFGTNGTGEAAPIENLSRYLVSDLNRSAPNPTNPIINKSSIEKIETSDTVNVPCNAKEGRIEGSATVALVGQNWIVGMLCQCDANGGEDRKFPIYGKVIRSFRECTRDEDWSLVKLDVLVKLPRFSRNFQIFAEKTGADAIQLKAPIIWQGFEFDDFINDLPSECSLDLQTAIHFECQRLLTDAAADESISKLFPWLAGLGAIVNVGSMVLEWGPSVVS